MKKDQIGVVVDDYHRGLVVESLHPNNDSAMKAAVQYKLQHEDADIYLVKILGRVNFKPTLSDD